MNTSVDLQGLAIDRGGTSGPAVKRKTHVWSRYVLPLVLILGFLSLVGWASWDAVFPPRPVTVIPVIATTAEVQQEGTPLFNAAGWIEPRPTPIRVAALAPGVVEKLLVVEDHEPTLQVLARLLTSAGHTVITASSVAEARKRVREQPVEFVISDLGLPDGNGIELMKGLRDSCGLRGIALSGFGMEEDLQRSHEAGFVAHLVKPVDFNELRRTLSRFGVGHDF